MLILDLYVLRQFLKILGVAFFALVSLYVIIDAFNNLEEFQLYAERNAQNILVIVFDYYRVHALTVFDRTYGMLALLASMATIAWFHRTRELTAILSGGISKGRFVRPIVVATVMVSGLGIANREWWMPHYRDRLTRNAQDWLGDTPRPFVPRFDHHTNILLGGRNLIRGRQRVEHPTFRLPANLARFGNKLIAAYATYMPAQDDRMAGFRLVDVERPEKLAALPSEYLEQQPLVLTAFDTDWLGPRECFVATHLTFEQLATGDQWQRFTSTRELIDQLRNPSDRAGADTRVRIHARIVQPFLDIALVFLGLPLVLRREQPRFFVAIGWGLLVVCGFAAAVITCHALGENYLLSPVLATWCPLFLFLPLAVLISRPFQE